MEPVLEFTKSQLVEAQRKYNESFLNNPQDYEEIDTSEDCAKQQIEHLLKFL